MSSPDMPENMTAVTRQRRRRRRNFLEMLDQNQSSGAIPVVNVGQRLRDLRNERGYSIRALAEMSQLNVNTLSMIENGKTSPSVATLQQLAIALQTPIASFFNYGTPKKKVTFQKSGQRNRAAFSHGTLEDLGAGMTNRGAEPFLINLESGANSGSTPIVHTGREFVYCLEGQLTYTIEGQDYLLEPGDSLLFEAHLEHHWQNNGEKPTRSLLVLCPSDEQDHPAERHFTTDITAESGESI